MLKNKNSLTQPARSRIITNFIIVCVYSNIDDSNEETRNLIVRLQRTVDSITIFNNNDDYLDFLTEIKTDKVFMVVCGSIGQPLASLIKKMTQVDSIYGFCCPPTEHEQWANQCKKVKGNFTQIELICDALKRDVRQSEIALTSISIVSTTSIANLDQLDQSFMYSQLLKEIICEIEHDNKDKGELARLFREQYVDNDAQLTIIHEFERDYELHSPIWWYTKISFLYTMLNQALRIQDTEIIIKMGFFLREIHRQIEQLHLETHPTAKMTVYRGQGMTIADFENVKQNKGGLLSFNSFLSTSTDQQVSFAYAESARDNPCLTGILFEMEIDSSISSIPFASLGNISYYAEEEILFSMHTVFRIAEMKQIDERLWKVNLILTSDNDQQLKQLTDYLRNEIREETGWHRMAILMVKMGKFNKAMEIYKSLLETKSYDDEKEFLRSLAVYHNNIGEVHRSMGDYSTALSSFTKTLEILQNSFPDNDPQLATIYSNIATVHQSMEDHSNAFSYWEKTLEIQQTSLPSQQAPTTTAYNNNNIGMMHQQMDHYSTALFYLKKSLEIQQKSLPSNHPDLAIIFNNIGMVHQSMGHYSTALSFFEKTLEIQQKSLPPSHPSLTVTLNNIGMIHQSIGEYSTALSYLEKSLEIHQQSLPSNHPELATTYHNIGMMHQLMGDHSTALLFFEKALEIQQESLPPNHPQLAIAFNHIGAVHQSMRDYDTALFYYEISLEIRQKSLSLNHPQLAITYNNIGTVHQSIGKYLTALSYYEKTLEIQQESLPPNHPELATTYGNIGAVHRSMGDYYTALSYYEIALEIQQKSLPSNHPSLANTYRVIGMVRLSMHCKIQNEFSLFCRKYN